MELKYGNICLEIHAMNMEILLEITIKQIICPNAPDRCCQEYNIKNKYSVPLLYGAS